MYLLLACISAGILTQAAAYTAFNERDHVNVSKQFKIYTYVCFNIASHVKPGNV